MNITNKIALLTICVVSGISCSIKKTSTTKGLVNNSLLSKWVVVDYRIEGKPLAPYESKFLKREGLFSTYMFRPNGTCEIVNTFLNQTSIYNYSQTKDSLKILVKDELNDLVLNYSYELIDSSQLKLSIIGRFGKSIKTLIRLDQIENSGLFFAYAENPPIFSYGFDSLSNLIYSNLNQKVRKSLGKYNFGFNVLIDKTGKLNQIKCIDYNEQNNSELLCPLINNIFKNSTLDWKPGTINGKSVNSNFYIEIDSNQLRFTSKNDSPFVKNTPK